jgi:hypothetical protein
MLKNLILMLNNLYKWSLFLLLPMLWVASSAHRQENSVAAMHPFYVSVTEINHNAAEKALEISCKVFADDMEQALKQNFKVSVDLTNAAQQEKTGSYIKSYVQKHLQLSANGKALPLHFVGFEKEGESVYCYFEAPGVPAVKKLDVVNSLLQDFTNSQINILHVSVNGTRKSTKLDFPAKSASFQF